MRNGGSAATTQRRTAHGALLPFALPRAVLPGAAARERRRVDEHAGLRERRDQAVRREAAVRTHSNIYANSNATTVAQLHKQVHNSTTVGQRHNSAMAIPQYNSETVVTQQRSSNTTVPPQHDRSTATRQ